MLTTRHAPVLVLPHRLTISAGLPRHRARWNLHVARTLYTVWDTGAVELLDARHCPRSHSEAERVIGELRAVVLDLTCRVEHLHLDPVGFSARLRLAGRCRRPGGGLLDVVVHDRQRISPPAVALFAA